MCMDKFAGAFNKPNLPPPFTPVDVGPPPDLGGIAIPNNPFSFSAEPSKPGGKDKLGMLLKFGQGFAKGYGNGPQQSMSAPAPLPQIMNDVQDQGGSLMQSLLAKLLLGNQGGPFGGYGGGGY